VTGLVFKTSRAATRVVAGGFDSHVPPPKELRSGSMYKFKKKIKFNSYGLEIGIGPVYFVEKRSWSPRVNRMDGGRLCG